MFFLRVLGLVVFIGLTIRPATAETPPPVVINELQWMGTSISAADEWIELRNTTDQVVDISGWALTKKSSGAEAPMLAIPAGSSIPPGGIWVVSNYGVGASSAMTTVPNFVTSDVALANSALQIKLYDANKVLIDTADDGTGNPLAGAFVSGEKIFAGMERNPNPGDGSQAAHWHTATKKAGLVETAVELGTPGWPNSNGRPVAVAGIDQTAAVGQVVNFDGSDSSDPEQQPLTWHWDFGDGAASSEPTPAHAYAGVGTFSVRLTVSDGVDESADTLTVTITEASRDPEPQTSALPTPPISSCRGLRLWSVLPNPVGPDEREAITVKNETSTEIVLTGCWLTVGSSEWSWPVATSLAAGQIVTVPYTQSRLRLVNSGGIVRLIDTDRQTLETTTYSTATEGAEWVRRADGWGWKLPPSSTSAKSAKKNTNRNVPVSYEHVPTIAELQNFASGDLVRLAGTISSSLHAMGDHQSTIEDSTGGCTIVVPATVKTLTVGQRVELRGKVRTVSGRRRLIVDEGGLRLLSSQALIARKVQIIDLGVDDTERLVQVAGTVATVSGSRFEVDDGTEILNVVIKPSTRMVRPRLAAGDRVTAVGILSAGTTGLRLYPRSVEDLKIERVLGATQVAQPVKVIPTAAGSPRWVYWAVAGAGLVAMNGRWIIRRIRNVAGQEN